VGIKSSPAEFKGNPKGILLTIPTNELSTRLTTILGDRLVFLGISLQNVLSGLFSFSIGLLDCAVGDSLLAAMSLASLDDYRTIVRVIAFAIRLALSSARSLGAGHFEWREWVGF
jgi:hypothetical protein